MAQSWVRADRSDGGGVGDSLFLDGNFVDAAGFVGAAFLTETGQHTFETLDQDFSPTWRAVATVDLPANNSQTHPVRVTLQQV